MNLPPYHDLTMSWFLNIFVFDWLAQLLFGFDRQHAESDRCSLAGEILDAYRSVNVADID